ncbi:hypothetical protein DMENIID0001_012750 [Sergentomyia squamirostris]
MFPVINETDTNIRTPLGTPPGTLGTLGRIINKIADFMVTLRDIWQEQSTWVNRNFHPERFMLKCSLCTDAYFHSWIPRSYASHNLFTSLMHNRDVVWDATWCQRIAISQMVTKVALL